MIIGYYQFATVISYPNLDGGSKRSAQPVSVWREAKSGDDVIVVKGVQVFAVVQVPQHSFAVFTAASAKRSVRRNRHRVQVTVMALVVDLDAAISQVPHFHHFVPAGRYDDGIRVIRGETNARYPVRVAVFLNRVLALGKSVP